MKRCYVSFLLYLALSVFGLSSVRATTIAFNSSASVHISETSGTYSGSVNYDNSLWNPGGVNSAQLTLFLSDDLSTILNSFSTIDLPLEFAQITDIRDGGSSLGIQSAVEVQQTSPLYDSANFFPFNNTFPGSDGFENPLLANPITAISLLQAFSGNGLITPSSTGYFDVDVTSLLNNMSASGILEFDLIALNLFDPTILPPVFLQTIALLGFDPLDPQTTFEDFVFDGAQLIVDYNSVPVPSIIWLLVSGFFGMILSRKMQCKNN